VTDFGLAQVQSDARLTITGDLVGTLRYMSPEQALAKRVVIDHRTDVYSLGATLYELLTLEPAYRGTDRQELQRQIGCLRNRPVRQAWSKTGKPQPPEHIPAGRKPCVASAAHHPNLNFSVGTQAPKLTTQTS
jgi:serine/threonine protein kinase